MQGKIKVHPTLHSAYKTLSKKTNKRVVNTVKSIVKEKEIEGNYNLEIEEDNDHLELSMLILCRGKQSSIDNVSIQIFKREDQYEVSFYDAKFNSKDWTFKRI